MLFARPSDGFKWVETERVQNRVNAEIVRCLPLAEAWEGVRERLRFTAHRDGSPVREEGAGFFIFEPTWDPTCGYPRMLLLYQILGDTVTVLSVNFQSE